MSATLPLPDYVRVTRHTISESNALSSMEMIAKDPLQRLLCMGRSRKPTSDVSRQNDENGMAFGNFNAILPFFNGPLQGSLPDTLPAGAI
jgi:hypothetical protein